MIFSLHSSELLSSFGEKDCDAIILLRKEIGDWRDQGGHKKQIGRGGDLLDHKLPNAHNVESAICWEPLEILIFEVSKA